MKLFMTAAVLAMSLYQPLAMAHTCPDPETSPLRWGTVPPPWEVNPFSPNPPQGGPNIHFVRANILVAGLGRGVMCTYRNTRGEFSIWWPVLVKIPARSDYSWIDTQGGFVCVQGVDDCQFYVAE